MRVVEIEREGECHFRVTWISGAQPSKTRILDSRDAAESFAISKAGATGYVISTLDMTADQLAAHHAKNLAK